MTHDVGPGVTRDDKVRHEHEQFFKKVEYALARLKANRLALHAPCSEDERGGLVDGVDQIPLEAELRLVKYLSRPMQTPGWVHGCLNEAKAELKAAENARLKSKGNETIASRRFAQFAAADALCMAESLGRLPDQIVSENYPVTEVAKASKDEIMAAKSRLARLENAWRDNGWYAVWLKDQAERIMSETKAPGRMFDPWSQASILARLDKRDADTWEAYRKRETRKPRGSGKRASKITKAKRLTADWQARNVDAALLLQELIIDGEPIHGLAHVRSIPVEHCLALVEAGLRDLRKTLQRPAASRDRDAMGPSKLPQEIDRDAMIISLSV